MQTVLGMVCESFKSLETVRKYSCAVISGLNTTERAGAQSRNDDGGQHREQCGPHNVARAARHSLDGNGSRGAGIVAFLVLALVGPLLREPLCLLKHQANGLFLFVWRVLVASQGDTYQIAQPSTYTFALLPVDTRTRTQLRG